MILAVIAESNGNVITGIPVNKLNGNKTIKNEAMKELLKNDYVYIMKCKFN